LSTSHPTFTVDPPSAAGGVQQGRSIGPRWRRFLAFAIDCIVLGIVGYALGAVFFDSLSRLGPWGRLVGFCIALPYFAILDSRIGGGKTVGKRLNKLMVVDAQGNTISFRRSLARYAIFGIPCSLYALGLPVGTTQLVLFFLLPLIIVGVGHSTLYLLIFNNETRQGLHDLAVASYVVDAGETGPVSPRPIWRRHRAILGGIVSFILITGAFGNLLWSRGRHTQFRKDAQMIQQITGVQRASVFDLISLDRVTGAARKTLIVKAVTVGKSANYESIADEAAEIILRNDPNARGYYQITIRVFQGYDIGIFSRWNHQEFTNSPAEWAHRTLAASPSQSSHLTHP
jgi:uncharacterized RDD family membrane protein YckC